MKLYIKNMVSLRCKLMVREELEKLGLRYESVDLGTAEISADSISPKQREQLMKNLGKSGLELMEDKRNVLVEKIKHAVIEMVHNSEEWPDINYSDYLSKKLGYNYTYLSNVFSEAKSTTLQHYIIMHKIERVKELLMYDELTLSEISYKLRYSSVAHLSGQFKQITGLTPSHYKELQLKHRQNLEDL